MKLLSLNSLKIFSLIFFLSVNLFAAEEIDLWKKENLIKNKNLREVRRRGSFLGEIMKVSGLRSTSLRDPKGETPWVTGHGYWRHATILSHHLGLGVVSMMSWSSDHVTEELNPVLPR